MESGFRFEKTKRIILIAAAVVLLAGIAVLLAQCAPKDEKIPIKVLILPKFQIGVQEDKISGEFSGEGHYYRKAFMQEAESYEIPGGQEGSKMYVKDGIAYYVIGENKVNAALTTTAVLSDERFDFSDAYVLSIGCCGSAIETTVMGDVFLITAAVDYDTGHHADIREMENQDNETWFHDEIFDENAYVQMDAALMDKVYGLIKDVPLETTDRTRRFMSKAFDGADWALRDPKVMRGTSCTGDNYWKGDHDHQNALLQVETYGCPDPYVATEMEDIGVAQAMQRLGMLDRLIILRSSVNMDIFMNGNSPESLWDPEHSEFREEDNEEETADIFPTAMENNYKVGKVIVKAILDGEL